MCKFEFHCSKLGEFTKNKTGHILHLMNEISKVFFIEKLVFHFEKQNLEHIGNSVYFHHNWWKERGITNNSSNIFEGCYWGKICENS